MTRIVGGRFAGRRLAVPGGARPTTDRVREAVFSSLDHRIGDWTGVRVLDVYAGSGALALEALSRGAAVATAVERGRAAVAVLRANAAALGAADAVVVVAADAARWAPPPGSRYDLVLLDPPYEVPAAVVADILRRLWAAGALAPGAIIVAERPARDAAAPWPSGWPPGDRRRYGETAVWYGRAQDDVADLEGV